MIKPRTPAGTLELLPGEQRAFNHMLEVIGRNFRRFGFLPIETPVFELTEVLLTKTGGETERQVYFVQSTGALAQGAAPELALRFDLTDRMNECRTFGTFVTLVGKGRECCKRTPQPDRDC